MFGVLFVVLLVLRHVNDRGRQLDKFDALYALFLIVTFLDATWMLIDGRAEFRTWHIALHVAYLSTMALTGYLWFLYTLDLFPAKSMGIRKYRFVLGIPVLIEIVLIFCSVWTNWMFIVAPDGTYIRGEYHIYTIFLNYGYMLLGSYVALRCRKKALLTMDRRRFGVAALFPVPIFVFTGAQMILPPGLPGLQGGVLVAFLLVYGTFQNVMITRDHLTGLPNRFAFERDLLERIQKHRPDAGERLYLMEGDLNKFKHINDTYGHPTGDHALQLTAQALSQVLPAYNAVAFRTGGDEFMMVAETDAPLDAAEVERSINAKLAELSEGTNFDLSMSLGMEEYDERMDFRTLIETVDKKLYAAKKSIPASA